MTPSFVQKVIDDYRQVSTREWIVNDFMKDIEVLDTYGIENSDFSQQFYEWYMTKGNDEKMIKELTRK